MKSENRIVTKSSKELAEALGLTAEDGAEIEFRAELNSAIIARFKKSKMTHAALAKKAGVSRSRLTGLLNNDSMGLSTDFMLKVLDAMGYKANLKISKIA